VQGGEREHHDEPLSRRQGGVDPLQEVALVDVGHIHPHRGAGILQVGDQLRGEGILFWAAEM
jgi:hypothetical protein